MRKGLDAAGRSDRGADHLGSRRAGNGLRLCVGILVALCVALGIRSATACGPGSPTGPSTTPSGTENPCAQGQGGANPVILFEGILKETYVDARLPTPGVPWSHTRVYNSRLTAESGGELAGPQGARWEVSGLTTWAEIDVGSSIEICIDAVRKGIYNWNAGTGKYDPPAASRTTLDYHDNEDGTGSVTSATLTSVYDDSASYTAGDLEGQWIEITSGTYDGERRVITENTATTITWEEEIDGTAAAGTTFKILDRVVMHEIDTGYTYSFAGTNGNWVTSEKGVMQSWVSAYDDDMNYTFDPNEPGGRSDLTTMTQGWYVNYYYISSGVNAGRIDKLDVLNGSNQVIHRVKYTYYVSGAGYSTDCGSDGDLIMVEVLKRAKGDDLSNPNDAYFSIKEVTQYRYCRGTAASTVDERDGEDWGHEHQMKMVVEPGTVDDIVSTMSTITAPSDILANSDTYDLNGGDTGDVDTVEEFADRIFQHYVSNHDTSVAQTTPWGGSDDLEDMYTDWSDGTSNMDETGFVKTEIVQSGCAVCGSGHKEGAIKYTFYYMELPKDSYDYDDVKRIIVEDITSTKDSEDDVKIRRNVYGLNLDLYLLRSVVITNPGDEKYWCQSTVLGTTKDDNTDNRNRPVEIRQPSAHTCVDNDGDVGDFVDPTKDSNDTNTLNGSDGVIYKNYYDANGYVIDKTIKKGKDGGEKLIYSADYGDGVTDDQPERLMIAGYDYDAEVTYAADRSHRTSGIKTDYEYDFYDTADTQLKVKITKPPKIAASQNGAGDAGGDPQTEIKEYYDRSGRLRWSKDGEGNVTYSSYHPDLHLEAYAMVDVETDDLPSELVNGSSGKWLDWEDGTTTVPSGFENTDNANLQLVTKSEYDERGRQVKSQDAEGAVTYTVHKDNVTYVFPAWDGTAHQPKLPIQVTETDDAGRVARQYTVDPSRKALDGSNLPTGLSANTHQGHYYTLTRNNYNDKGQLESVDRYHDIPTGTSDGTLSTNYYRTFYRYDSRGRKTHTIQVVSGTSISNGLEQVSKVVYDEHDRAIEYHEGVSGTGHDMGSSYATDPTMQKLKAQYYDEGTAGTGVSGVGDGLVTSTREYFNSSGDYTYTKNYYDWRGRLRGSARGKNTGSAVGPFTVSDYDHKGRVVATAAYTSEPSWSTVVGDTDYAAGVTSNRGSLAKTLYDDLGRAYRSETYSISGGSAGDKLVSDNYYDRNSRLVATFSSGAGGTEKAYDGAGREVETRIVTELESTKYSGGAYVYRDPQPEATSGGDDKVIQISRTAYDKIGSATESLAMEVHHDDTDGLYLTTGPSADYVQTWTHRYYEPDTHRLKTTANYGCHSSTWSHQNEPEYQSYEQRPTSSSSYYLVTNNTYADGRLQTITDPKGIDTKFTYDDLGREVRIEEDEGGSDERSTLMEYDGLGSITRRVADIDKDGVIDDPGDQITTYTYADSYNARLATKITYPDSTDSGWDVVSVSYHWDGKVNTRTTQKAQAGDAANVITTSYDDLRRPHRQTVSILGTDVDGSVRDIKYTYDTMGRRQKVTSSSETDGTPVVNEVAYQYNGLGALYREYQEHEGGTDGSTLYVQYNYDDTDSDGVYTKAMRLKSVRYPNTREVHLLYTDPGDSSGISDAISRVTAIATASTRGASDANVLAAYYYNGAGRLVIEDFVQPDVKLDYYDGSAGTYSYAGFDR